MSFKIELPKVDCRYGSPMGRRDVPPGEDNPQLCLQRVPFIDGCYDRGGAYWGGPANLWCASDRDGQVWLFVRAGSRAEAMERLRADRPGLRFHREARSE